MCSKVLPLLLHHLLSSPSDVRSAVSSGISHFFAAHYSAKGFSGLDDVTCSRPSTPETSGGGTCRSHNCMPPHFVRSAGSSPSARGPTPAYLDFRSLGAMLDVLEHLRHQEADQHLSPWSQNFWIPDLNYLHAAAAALTVGRNFSVLLYVDIWCQNLRMNKGASG